MIAALAFSLLLCSEASAQMLTVPGSTIRIAKDRRVVKDRPCVDVAPVHSAASSPAPPLLGASLTEVFDTANMATRKAIMTMVPRLASADERRELLLRGLRHGGTREGEFLAAMSAMIALQLGDEGRGILWHAMSQHMVRDERTRTTVLAALQRR